MTLKELLPDVCPASLETKKIVKIERNVKNIDENTAFFCLGGANCNRNDIKAQLALTPPAVVVAEGDFGFCVPTLTVSDVRKRYAEAAARIYGCDFGKLTVVGITGTNGKTTTATFLTKILQDSGKKVCFIGTGKIEAAGARLTDENYSMTTPDPEILYPAIAKAVRLGCEYLVMEVSSHALALDKVAPIPFDIAIFTGLSAEHLDFHKDMATYFAAKAKLFAVAKYGILAWGAPYAQKMQEAARCKTERVGYTEDCDIRFSKILSANADGIKFRYEGADVSIKLFGEGSAFDAALAIRAAEKLGISRNFAVKSLASARVCGRAEKIESDVDGLSVYIDYAHTPAAMEEILSAFSDKKPLVVFGCGGERDREKRPKMAKIAEKYASFVYLTSDNPRGEDPVRILFDAAAGFEKYNHLCLSDREAAIRLAVKNAPPGGFICILGKGHERYVIDRDGKHPFDERAIILDALNERRSERR